MRGVGGAQALNQGFMSQLDRRQKEQDKRLEDELQRQELQNYFRTQFPGQSIPNDITGRTAGMYQQKMMGEQGARQSNLNREDVQAHDVTMQTGRDTRADQQKQQQFQQQYQAALRAYPELQNTPISDEYALSAEVNKIETRRAVEKEQMAVETGIAETLKMGAAYKIDYSVFGDIKPTPEALSVIQKYTESQVEMINWVEKEKAKNPTPEQPNELPYSEAQLQEIERLYRNADSKEAVLAIESQNGQLLDAIEQWDIDRYNQIWRLRNTALLGKNIPKSKQVKSQYTPPARGNTPIIQTNSMLGR